MTAGSSLCGSKKSRYTSSAGFPIGVRAPRFPVRLWLPEAGIETGVYPLKAAAEMETGPYSASARPHRLFCRFDPAIIVVCFKCAHVRRCSTDDWRAVSDHLLDAAQNRVALSERTSGSRISRSGTCPESGKTKLLPKFAQESLPPATESTLARYPGSTRPSAVTGG